MYFACRISISVGIGPKQAPFRDAFKVNLEVMPFMGDGLILSSFHTI